MKVKAVYDALEQFGPWTASHIDQVARRLREMRMLPIGGRGLSAPDLDWEHVATLILALSAADRAGDAAYDVTRYAPLQSINDDYIFHDGESVGEVLTSLLILQAEQGGNAIEELTITRSWPTVIIRHEDGRAWQYGYGVPGQIIGHGYKYPAARIDVRFDGQVLRLLVLSMLSDKPDS